MAVDIREMNRNCCRTSFGFVYGCVPKETNTWIKVLWTFLIILAVTSCLVLGCVIYSPQTLPAAPSDTRTVDTHVHFLFCESVKLNSMLHFNAYLVHGTPEIDPLRREMSNWSTALFVEASLFNYFALYLLRGSRIQISYSAKMCISFYVIVGRDNFELWTKHQSCDSCYLNYSKVCMDHNNTFVMETANNEEYYFVYTNTNNTGIWVNFQLNVNRSVYNIGEGTNSCVDATSCNVMFDGPDETVVYMVSKDNDIGMNNHPELLAECVPRIWSYLVLHGVTVLLIGITGSLIIKKQGHDSEISCYNRNSNRTPENTRLLRDSNFPPSYSSVTLEPPKYEDIMCDENPPPYLEATKLLSDRRTIVANTNISDNDRLSIQTFCASENTSH